MTFAFQGFKECKVVIIISCLQERASRYSGVLAAVTSGLLTIVKTG